MSSPCDSIETLKPEIGHDGGHQTAALQLAALGMDVATNAMIWSPSITSPFSSADDHPVGITIQCNANVSAQFAHLLAHGFRMGGTTFFIDVDAIGSLPISMISAPIPTRRVVPCGKPHHLPYRSQCASHQVSTSPHKCAWQIQCSAPRHLQCAWRGQLV